jgi:hypothetical protein
MLLSAVFLLSFSTLAFEVLLTRVFSVGQWNHLSFMVLSIALFGFAAAGTYLSILDIRKKNWQKTLSTKLSVTIIAGFYSVCACFALITLNQIPFDYFRIPVEPTQLIYLMIVYILIALPFFCSGLAISLAYAVIPEKSGPVYFASMAGAALGAAFPAIGLSFLSVEKLIILSSVLPLTMIPLSMMLPLEKPAVKAKNARFLSPVIIAGCALILSAAVFFMTEKGFSLIETRPSPYKALSQIMQYPDTRITDKQTSLRGKIERIESPYIRFAPGLSLKYAALLPKQHALFRDADNQLVLYAISSDRDTRFASYTLSYLSHYLSKTPKKVLVIQNGGGLAIPCAIASGASQITIIEQNHHLASSIQAHYKLPVINKTARSFLKSSSERFDIIQIESWGGSVTGADALTQNYLFTKNAFFEYLNHLSPRGFVTVSRKLLLPPANTIRLWAQVYAALLMQGSDNPAAHIAVLRNWDTFTLIASPEPIQDSAVIRKFAEALNFDIVFLPDLNLKKVNRFNMFEEPYHYLEINRLKNAYERGPPADYFDAYLLDVVPQSDNRPYPGRFLKWRRLKSIYQSMGSRLYALLMSGEIIVSAVLMEALAVTSLLLLVPLLFILKAERKPPLAQVVYFLGIGAGFMFVELFFIKRLVIVFGDPVISFTVVLSGMLIFSGFGALWSHMGFWPFMDIRPHKGLYQHRLAFAGMRKSLGALVGMLIITLVLADWSLDTIMGLPVIWHYIFALVLLLPVGFLMGLPFPLGMRFLLNNPAQRAYAWSVNGCASVLTSIISAQIALSFSHNLIMTCAVLAYVLALISLLKK